MFTNFYSNKDNIASKDAEFINKINPKILKIKQIIWTIEIIKAVSLLKCTKIEGEFNNESKLNFELSFKNTQIQLFDSKSDEMLTFEWESIKFKIIKSKIKNVKFLKINANNFLFIPLDTIDNISSLWLREIFNANDINKQFADLSFQHQLNTNGFILPVWYLNKIFIKLNESELNLLNQFKDIIQIFKEKHIELNICSLGKLLKINKLLPNDFSKINFKYFGKRSTKIIDNIDLINLKFWEIMQLTILSPDEFQFWWIVLRSSRTRFNLTSICLYFNLLSECLTVLSLCSDCPELESVDLWYSKADVENKNEVIKQAKREFRHKFGFIQKLEI